MGEIRASRKDFARKRGDADEFEEDDISARRKNLQKKQKISVVPTNQFYH